MIETIRTMRMRLPMRARIQRDGRGTIVRFWWRWAEVAWIFFGLQGFQADIEFPSDWHEQRLGWVTLGFGLFKVAFAFPWPWTVEDHYQCSGPKFGFVFFGDGLHLHWGKSKGTRDDPFTIISMPWRWRHRLHEVIGPPELHFYTYVLSSGEVQLRTARIKPERRTWTRPWFPWKRVECYIDVEFSDEVGERSGTWKGGCMGCGYEMKPGETPVQALRRMEVERKF